MKKTTGKFFAGVIGLLLFCTTTLQIRAEGTIVVMEKYTTDTDVVMYVGGIEGNIDEVSYQVGTTVCTVESVKTVEEAEDGIYTLVLLDNSLSVMNKYGTTIKEILKDVVASRATGEQFAIATMGEHVAYLTEYSSDYAILKQAIEGIEEENKDTYIIENLYEAVESFNNMQHCGYKRIIVISDGVDAAELGYSKTELEALLEESSYPIYTIGVLGQGSQEELQDMFSLARTTSANYFCLDEVEDTLSVVQGLDMDNNIIQVKAVIPEDMRDGSTQNSQISIVSEGQTYQTQCEVELPFLVPVTSNETNTEETIEEAEEIEEVEETIAEVETDKKISLLDKEISLFGITLPLILLVSISVGLLILIAFAIIILRNAKKKRVADKKVESSYEILEKKLKNKRNDEEKAIQITEAAEKEMDKTENANEMQCKFGSMPVASGGGERVTQLLFDETSKPGVESEGITMPIGHRVILTNITDSAQMYQCGMADKVIIGRNPACTNIVISGDNAVSEKHCEIGIDGNKFYIKDLGSSNGTKVNGIRINTVTEVTTGCTLKLGRLEYRLTVE